MLCHDVFVNICYRCANICNVRTMNICYVMLCYVYVNCVLGYEHICYVNMLHVFSCTFLHENNIQTKTNNTGYPALDPTANKYLSGSGWEISVFLFLYMFFDCKCKSLKRLGENINNRKKLKNNRKTQRKTETTEIQDIQPSTRPRINISQVPAGRFLFFFSVVIYVFIYVNIVTKTNCYNYFLKL